MDIGGKLRIARKSLGYTQEELANEAGLTRDAILSIENGSRNVKVDELCKLAHVLERPITYFLTDKKPEPLVVASRGGAESTRQIRKAELWLRRRMADFAELATIPRDSQWQRLKDCTLTGEPVLDNAKTAAYGQRNNLGLGKSPIRDLRAVLEDQIGIPVFGQPVENTGFCGMLLFDKDKCIAGMLVNQDMIASRRRFTLAHEFGHYIWKISNKDMSPDILFVRETGSTGNNNEERFADAFAAHFLAPDEGIREFVKAEDSLDLSDPENVMMLGTHFGISFQAITYRLQDLGIIANEIAERLRAETSPTRLSSFRTELEPFASISPLLRRIAVDAYYEGRISAGRCAEMVEMTAAEFVNSIEEAETDTLAEQFIM